MASINQLAQQMRNLRLSRMAAQVETLISEAEANELSYLQFAESLLDHDLLYH
jgi:hypothetical protein